MSASRRPRCYVASPLGFTEAGRDWYARVLLPALAPLVEPVDPWSLTTALEVAAAARAGRQAQLAREIGARNAEAIRSSALLVAVLEGQELDAGTAAEVGYGSALGLRCLGLRTDLRQTGEDGAALNLQVQSFIEASGGSIAASLGELVTELELAVGSVE